jgi:hypothetical protein
MEWSEGVKVVILFAHRDSKNFQEVSRPFQRLPIDLFITVQTEIDAEELSFRWFRREAKSVGMMGEVCRL